MKKMLKQIFTTKSHMTQAFPEGQRTPVTVLKVPPQVISQLKTTNADGYNAIQVAIGQKSKDINKPQAGHLKQAKLKKAPQWLQEIKLSDDKELKDLKVGDSLPVADIISENDTINATAISKGKGFSGVMKRHNFKGAPRSHGQFGRQRHGGSIGRTTTPGRVLPGKKMPGRMGSEVKTVTNLKVLKLDLDNNQIWVSGPVPGARNQLVTLTITQKDNQE